jgi:nucleoid DNA-binding protein
MPKTKKEFISLLAKRMNTDEATTKKWVEGYADTLIDIFKTGEGVTVEGLGVHIPVYTRSRFPVMSVHCLFKND